MRSWRHQTDEQRASGRGLGTIGSPGDCESSDYPANGNRAVAGLPKQAGATRGDPYPGNARRTGPYAGKQKDQQKQLTNQPTTLQSDLM